MRVHPHPSCGACPNRALPRQALLRAAAVGRRCVLGTPLLLRARASRRRVTRGDLKGVFRGCDLEGVALKWLIGCPHGGRSWGVPQMRATGGRS
jgi:hypothetical protein